ncbi:GNAT family N-acetyltransferase [Deinococcus sp. QL22]|uniref:GNAT family N-acetyltransferase n=1 Tax=Deinococcus sp. QL22 TaxID=2939437 RepID=UPI0020183732|nr:GNAT family N-acetyltransferase [Deinococcus sp. QL22]UQN08434.1 GNAT family N-acetyltransferase [Deinococcus sp. QL22]
MEIRPLESGDLPNVTQVFIATFNAAPWGESWTQETASNCLKEMLMLPRSVAWGAWENDQCLGAALGHDQQKDTALTHEIKEVFVNPQRQGQGIGKNLLNAYIEAVLGRGVKSIYLLTAQDSDAEAFYQRAEFRRARRQIVLVRP